MLKPKGVMEDPEDPGDKTQFMNKYIVVVTSILDKTITGKEILGLYRLRWQVELYFKRLKSLMGFGDIPNKTEKNIKTWLEAKLAAAILLEITTAQVDFSPSG
jgi:IS4 transposase